MGQNKLENQIKEQLNAREIKPTEMAWDRLDAMLSVAEEKKSKKGLGWMSIAAVFIGLLLTGFVIFQLNSSDVPVENSVVNQENKKVEEQTESVNANEISNPIIKSPVTIQVAEVKSVKNNKSIINQKTNHQSNQKTNQTQNPIIEKKELIADNSFVNEIKMEPNLKIVPITVNPDKLLASVETSKKEKTSKATVNVNAKSLLAQAEGEQNPNFKESRLQKLKRNFKMVKTAVANRNNQE